MHKEKNVVIGFFYIKPEGAILSEDQRKPLYREYSASGYGFMKEFFQLFLLVAFFSLFMTNAPNSSWMEKFILLRKKYCSPFVHCLKRIFFCHSDEDSLLMKNEFVIFLTKRREEKVLNLFCLMNGVFFFS